MIDHVTSGSLLLVEDEPLVGMALADGLEEYGFQVTWCETFAEAMDLIRAERSISAVVTDIRLGSGPNGWDVARRVRQQFPAMPVVYITGDSAAAFQNEKVPESILLQKPFAVGRLVEVVDSLIH